MNWLWLFVLRCSGMDPLLGDFRWNGPSARVLSKYVSAGVPFRAVSSPYAGARLAAGQQVAHHLSAVDTGLLRSSGVSCGKMLWMQETPSARRETKTTTRA